MRLSAQEEYGLRCLLQVARRGRAGPVALAAIAEAEGLSVEYAGKLMRELRRGGLVTSSKGPGGGYRLAVEPQDLSIWSVIAALGGALFPEDFCDCHPGQHPACVHTGDCAVRALWRSADGVLREFLERVSLADLVREEHSMVRWLDPDEAAPGR